MLRREVLSDGKLETGAGRLVVAGGRLLRQGIVLTEGLPAVVYEIDLTNDDELAAANALFNETYYVNAHGPVWPDEKQIIEKYVPERGARILEICCGAGRVAGALVRGGNQVCALDNSEECIHYAGAVELGLHERQNRAAVDYRIGDARALPFADGEFDLGFCFENSLGVFFSARDRVVSELVRVCRTVIFGLREVEGVGDELQIYVSKDNFIEIAQVHSRSHPRFAGGVKEEGQPRPWGGREWFWILGTTG
jgi:SAM-dependent methyltransferase